LRESERERNRDREYVYIDAVDGVWEIYNARNNRRARRKVAAARRTKRLQSIREKEVLNLNQAIGRKERR